MDAVNGGIIAPDFLALGLGGTNMMAMLWTVAMGRTAVGVEMRGDPFLGVHWNIRVDFYHQLGPIDESCASRSVSTAHRPPLGISWRMRSSMATIQTSILWEPSTISNSST